MRRRKREEEKRSRGGGRGGIQTYDNEIIIFSEVFNRVEMDGRCVSLIQNVGSREENVKGRVHFGTE